VHDVAGVEIVQAFEDLDNVGRNQALVEFAKGFQCLPERSVFDIPEGSVSIDRIL